MESKTLLLRIVEPSHTQIYQRFLLKNIRQLQNVIFRTLALTDKSVVDDIDICFTTNPTDSTTESVPITEKNQSNYQDITTLESAVSQFESDLLTKLYIDYPSTRKLAKRLDVSHAKISRKLIKYAIEKQ